MRECRVIVPMFDNDGERLSEVHQGFQKALCKEFGGYTRSHGHGGWVNDDGNVREERVYIYDVAIKNDRLVEDQELILVALIQQLRIDAKQEAIYYRRPNGEIALLTE